MDCSFILALILLHLLYWFHKTLFHFFPIWQDGHFPPKRTWSVENCWGLSTRREILMTMCARLAAKLATCLVLAVLVVPMNPESKLNLGEIYSWQSAQTTERRSSSRSSFIKKEVFFALIPLLPFILHFFHSAVLSSPFPPFRKRQNKDPLTLPGFPLIPYPPSQMAASRTDETPAN